MIYPFTYGIFYLMKAMLIRHNKFNDELGNTVEIKLWKVPLSKDKPHGYKYSLVYIVGDKRVIGYDNSEKKGDHRHYRDTVELYKFQDIRQLIRDFFEDINRYKEVRL